MWKRSDEVKCKKVAGTLTLLWFLLSLSLVTIIPPPPTPLVRGGAGVTGRWDLLVKYEKGMRKEDKRKLKLVVKGQSYLIKECNG
jgi:hypothetical protein